MNKTLLVIRKPKNGDRWRTTVLKIRFNYKLFHDESFLT